MSFCIGHVDLVCNALDSAAGDRVLDRDFMTGAGGDEETGVPAVCECFSASPLSVIR